MDLTLAGLGSRFAAAVLDFVLQVIVFIVFLLAATTWLDGFDSGAVAVGVVAVSSVTIFLGYHVLFEVLWQGQTLGKRALKVRVVRADGGPVGVVSSIVRTVMRLIDFLPAFYAVGLVAAVISPRVQRLGDLAASTLVVRIPKATTVASGLAAGLPRPAAVPWDVSGVTAEQLGTLRHFAARRLDLDPDTRSKMALLLYEQIKPNVVATHHEDGPEGFVLQTIVEKDRDR